jgi:hypothetical protein
MIKALLGLLILTGVAATLTNAGPPAEAQSPR